MARLLQTGRELKTFHIKESDLEDFRAYAKKNVLFSVIKDTRSTSGIVDLVTNVDYVPLVNHYLEQRGYPAPAKEQEEEAPKSRPRARPEHSLTTAREWLDSQADEEYGYEGRRRLLRNHPSSPAWNPAGGVGRDAGDWQGPTGQRKNCTKIKMNMF